MLLFDYHPETRMAVLTWPQGDLERSKWLSLVISAIKDGANGDTAELVGYCELRQPWWAFLPARTEIFSIFRGLNLRIAVDYDVTERAKVMLRAAKERHNAYEDAKTADPIGADELRVLLKAAGFLRGLTPEQERNVGKLASLPSGATFSVPGAGKTTEALATFALRRQHDDRLMVVAPKNAFAAWDEQVKECIPHVGTSFARLRKTDQIPRILAHDPKLFIISYQQLARSWEIIAEHLARFRTHVFLDESHRIKGPDNISTKAVQSFSHLPVSKLIMSGTPMPQSPLDLVPQINFLFPEIKATEETAIDAVKPIYVRTRKSELNLPKVDRVLKRFAMDPLQQRLYELMRSEVVREASQALTRGNKAALRTLGRSVTRLLQFTSNPGLLAGQIAFAHSAELANALAEGRGPKFRYVIDRTRELVAQGNKVLIWSSFVQNVDLIAHQLQDLGAVFIHGGVDAGDEDDDETREGKIKLFHDDPFTRVMVANPAAASEGISLHRICHHAIYLDRSFNAAQYLQSEDRIHRLGLPKDTKTTIEIVECVGTVDEAVRNRLEYKIDLMAKVLNDPGLIVAPDVIFEEGEYLPEGDVLDIGDVKELIRVLGG